MKLNFLLINKPVDWTSHDVVAYIRSFVRKNLNRYGIDPTTKNIRVGHAGTLDPFATGLLIIGVGRESTKRLDEFKNLPKVYEAVLKLGATTDTYDCTGEILKQVQSLPSTGLGDDSINKITKKQVREVLKTFLGKQSQIPPMFSAKKVKGKKLYELARQGIEIERRPCEIEIYKIKLTGYKYPYLSIHVKCSTGTYIRTLAHDIGQKLGVGAYCDELKRTRIGKHKLWRARKVPFNSFIDKFTKS